MKSKPIVMVAKIKVPRALVYAALTDEYLLRQWFPTRVKSDPRRGGRFKYVWVNKGQRGSPFTQQGRYISIVPGRKISYPWSMPGVKTKTLVEFLLSGRGGKTTVTMKHSGWRTGKPWDEFKSTCVGGWKFFMRNLKTWLARGHDGRNRWGIKTAHTCL